MADDGTPPFLQGTDPGLYSVLPGEAALHSGASVAEAGSVLEPHSGTPPSTDPLTAPCLYLPPTH